MTKSTTELLLEACEAFVKLEDFDPGYIVRYSDGTPIMSFELVTAIDLAKRAISKAKGE